MANLVFARFRIAASYKYVKSQVRTTQYGIKYVLRERWHAWTEARELYNGGYRPSKDELFEDKEEDVGNFPMKPDTTSSDKSSTSVTKAS